MYINSIYNNLNPAFTAKNFINGGNWVPISEFKGPVLKLTKKDNIQIKTLREQITSLEIELIKLRDYISGHFLSTNMREVYENEIIANEGLIKTLNSDIDNIKRKRYAKQLEKWNREHT